MKDSPDSAPEPASARRFLDRRSPPHMATLVLVAGLSALSMNMFLPSLPGMAAWFETEYAVVQLSVSGYLAVTGLLQLFIGPLSDRYGRRPVLLWSMALFVAASVGCVLAPDIETFLAFRALQAAVASGMVLSRAIVRDRYSDGRAASMIGYLTMGMAVVPMLSPMLGGLLEQLFDWRANFIGMALFGVAVLALAWADLGETNAHASASIAEQLRAYPELFRSRRFWGYALVCAFSSGSFFAFLGGAPFVASSVLGMAPAELGFYFSFIATGYMMGNFISGRFSGRIGINRMMFAGALLTGAAMIASNLLFAVGVVHPLALFGPVMFVGVGNGLTIPNAMAGFLSVRPHLAGSASGLGGALMIGGGAGLSATTGALLGPETGPYPLLLMMLATAIGAVLCTLYVIRVERIAGPLRRNGRAL